MVMSRRSSVLAVTFAPVAHSCMSGPTARNHPLRWRWTWTPFAQENNSSSRAHTAQDAQKEQRGVRWGGAGRRLGVRAYVLQVYK
jgi:hypothetical protein